ncbi:hypothetical protein T484DRAFT_1957756 [Baffinella frigidus]|nr:hypothetical protein T484DRAFT_1957756 [Cryptophyta sp. CCMP2293]|mmetsp:Transcript_21812/g.52463  ORF Transcript_21812/g.52463 Transcript_21812/m.52463 type:complete len:145 (+) Transcript_21812:178-612(+)
MAKAAGSDSFQGFADDFSATTRLLKSLVLLRASKPDEDTNLLLEEVEQVLSKAEKQMHSLKSCLASECQHLRQAAEIMEVSQIQAAQLEHIKKGQGLRGKSALADMLAQRPEQPQVGGDENDARPKPAGAPGAVKRGALRTQRA